MTRTRVFGSGSRESHDATAFYGRRLYNTLPSLRIDGLPDFRARFRSIQEPPEPNWYNRFYCHDATDMRHVPDQSVALVFTSPPYNVGKEYDADMDMNEYLTLIGRVAAEVYRVLVPGGRYVINIANLGRKPYIPLTAYFYAIHTQIGFLPAGEVVWRKARGASGSCAWGTWLSAKGPRLRDVHEMLLVFVKDRFDRPDLGESTIDRDEFMSATLSVWEIPPESATRVGHPAPFPVALAERVIHLWSYRGDVVLDPFCGSGTTCVAAARLGRRYVGYDIVPEYVALAERRIFAAREGWETRSVAQRAQTP